MSQYQVSHFSLTLLTNAIVSQSSATAGDHESLDFIPGSTLLGVAASQLYSTLSEQDANMVFQSGAVRFSDALPCTEQEAAWPVPFCWHQIKGENIYEVDGEQQRLLEAAVFDPSQESLEPGKQPKQLRAGHVTASGRMLIAAKDYELKTAINAHTGGAAQSQLFGYQSLKAGQIFTFQLVCDAHVSKGLIKQIEESLTGQIFIGRSRSAQFGQAFVTPIDALTPVSSTQQDNKLRLWLLSDMALLDNHGNPLLTPTAQALGLPEGSRWLEQESFIRTRRYVPFNAKRRSYDVERQVISRGSVLVFAVPDGELSNALLERLQFVGQHQAAGLGRVAVNPTLLTTAHPQFAQAVTTKSEQQQAVAMPNSVLARVLQQKVQVSADAEQVAHYAEEFVRKVQSALLSAGRWAGLSEGVYPADVPARTQWGEIRHIALAHKEASKIRQQLFDNGKNPHALLREREGQTTWSLPVGPAEKIHQRIEQAFDDIPASFAGQVLAQACTQLMSDRRLTAQQGGR